MFSLSSPRVTSPLFAALACACLLSACTSTSENVCTDESDCFAGEICVQNMCARTLPDPETDAGQPDSGPDTETPDSGEDTGTSDAGDDTGNPDPDDTGSDDTGSDIPDADPDDAGDTSPCEPNPCSEPDRGVCTAEGDDAICGCDEGLVDVGDACVRFACDAPGLGPVMELSSADGSTQNVRASVAWANDSYLIVWSDDRASDMGSTDIYAARFDAAGQRIGPERRLTSSPGSSTIGRSSLVKAAEGYGLIWRDERGGPNRDDAYFQRLDESGQPLGSPLALSSGLYAQSVALVWTGTHFIAMWGDNASQTGALRLARIDASGQRLGDTVVVSTSNPSGIGDLVWTGDALGVVFRQNASTESYFLRTFFRRYDADLNPLDDSPIRVDDGVVSSPTITWTGTHFTIAGHSDSYVTNRLQMATFDADGELVTGLEQISFIGEEISGTHGIWTGQDHVYAWRQRHDIRAQRFSEPGVAYNAPFDIKDEGRFPWYPTINWNGDRALLVWNVGLGDDGEGYPERYRFMMRTYCPE